MSISITDYDRYGSDITYVIDNNFMSMYQIHNLTKLSIDAFIAFNIDGINAFIFMYL